MPEYPCSVCGKPVEMGAGARKQRGQVYCSDACRRASVTAKACIICGAEFLVSQISHSQRYCSPTCRRKAKFSPDNSLAITRACLKCGKPFQTTEARIQDGHGKYCSISCARSGVHTGRPKPKSRENVKLANEALNRSGLRGSWSIKPKVTCTCEICGKKFDVWPSREDKQPPRYCSRECMAESKRRVVGPGHPLWNRSPHKCEWCGKEVMITPSKARSFRFCSRRCAGSSVANKMALNTGPTGIERPLMSILDRLCIPYCWQHHIANWLVDITLPKYRVAIECDGDYWHSSESQRAKDANKTNWLRAHKWTVFRFLGSEITADPEACIAKVLAHIQG